MKVGEQAYIVDRGGCGRWVRVTKVGRRWVTYSDGLRVDRRNVQLWPGTTTFEEREAMMEKRWKATERRIAAALGGRRVPVSGRQRADVPDIAHDELALEVKDRNALPGWLHNGLDQAHAIAKKGGGLIPCLVLREKRQRTDDAYCVLRLRDVRALLARGVE